MRLLRPFRPGRPDDAAAPANVQSVHPGRDRLVSRIVEKSLEKKCGIDGDMANARPLASIPRQKINSGNIPSTRDSGCRSANVSVLIGLTKCCAIRTPRNQAPHCGSVARRARLSLATCRIILAVYFIIKYP